MNYPLITVIIVTYNSGKYVLGTLNSLINTNYPNLQIIVSDDSSIDDTIGRCREWAEIYSSLYDISLLTSDTNRGTAHNINKALPYVKGEYVKIIAGDDEFCNNYFFKCIEYFFDNPDCSILSTNVKYLYEANGISISGQPFTSLVTTNKLDPIEMYRTIIRYNVIFSPTCMIKYSLIQSIGGFDERYPLCEDLFFYAKVLKSGYRIHFIDECLIKYRIHDQSVQAKNKSKVFTKYHHDYIHGKRDLLWQDLRSSEVVLEKLNFILYNKIINNGNDYKRLNIFYMLCMRMCNILLRFVNFRYYLNIINRKSVTF